jgi:hypothetical protein
MYGLTRRPVVAWSVYTLEALFVLMHHLNSRQWRLLQPAVYGLAEPPNCICIQGATDRPSCSASASAAHVGPAVAW